MLADNFAHGLPTCCRVHQHGLIGEHSGRARGGSECILVVDDEELVRGLAEVVLKRAGYEVLQTGFGIGPGRDGAWAYFDTSAALGVMVEAVEPPSAMPPEA